MAKRHKMKSQANSFVVEPSNQSPLKDKAGNIKTLKMQMKPSNKTEQPIKQISNFT